MVKSLPANAGDLRDVGLIPGLGRSPGEGNDNPHQYSYLEDPMDRGAWWTTVYKVPQSRTRLDNLAGVAAIPLTLLYSVIYLFGQTSRFWGS